MAISIKFFTVVTRIETIEKKYPGGIEAYAKDNRVTVPYRDRHIAGAIFMSMQDAGDFIGKLVKLGFSHVVNNEAGEIAVLEMFHGPLMPCPWLETSIRTPFDGKGKKDSVCWFKNTGRSEREIEKGTHRKEDGKKVPGETPCRTRASFRCRQRKTKGS